MESYKRALMRVERYMFERWEDFINFCFYWWFRYLMITELYMCEKWERFTIHVIFAILFFLFWYFNYSVLLLMGSILGMKTTQTSDIVQKRI